MKLGLVGQNIAYSLSPQIHQFWMEQLGLLGTYDCITPPQDCVSSVFSQLDGFNVTIPYKKTFFELVDQRSAWAERCRAVNTVYLSDGFWVGDNTDVLALMEMIPDSADNIVVLGNGGAAQAVRAVAEYRQQNAILISRDMWHKRHDYITDADVVINATPVGLWGQGCPVEWLPEKNLLVIDMVYQPRQTRFLTLAQKLSLPTKDGFEMLQRQARHSFSRWWNVLPDLLPETWTK